MARIHHVEKPVSSFLSVDKDTDLIISKMLKNDRLKRLLYYPKRDCITNASGECPNLTEEETISLVDTYIRRVPRLALDNDETLQNYIILVFDSFAPNPTNPYYRDNAIIFHIICNFDNWHLADGQLRPYRIAAEIDSMFNEAHLSCLGHFMFIGAENLPINDNYAGITLYYSAIHGDEDKQDFVQESANNQFMEEFNEMWNK